MVAGITNHSKLYSNDEEANGFMAGLEGVVVSKEESPVPTVSIKR